MADHSSDAACYRSLARRAARLCEDLRQARADARNLGTVRVEGDDELAALAREINLTLTQTARVQSDLAHSEAQYSSIVDSQTELICRWLPDGTLTYVNEAYCRYFSRSRESLIGHSYAPLIPDEYAHVIEGVMAGFSPESPLAICQHPVILDTGELRWQQWTDHALFDEAGQLTEVQSVGRDITQQHWAEETVRAQRDLALALLTATDLMSVLGQLLTTACNLPGIECGGVYIVDETTGDVSLVGSHNLHPEFAARVAWYAAGSPNAALLHAGQPLHVRPEVADWGPEVAVYPEHLAVIPIMYEGRAVASLNLGSYAPDGIPETSRQAVEAVAAQAGVVIGRIRTERELQESYENLQALFANLSDLITVGDETGRVLDVNPAASRILGYGRGELLSMQIEEMHPPERRAEALRIVGAMLQGATNVCMLPLMRKDGTHLPVETVVTQGHWNKRPAIFGISRDLSDAERAKHALAESTLNRAMAQELQQRSRHLVMAQEGERRRIAMELHDEVGQQLTGLRLLLEHHPGFAPEQCASRTAKAHEVAGQLLETVRQMSLDLRPAMLDLRGLGEALSWHLARYTEQTGVQVAAEISVPSEFASPEQAITAYRIVQEALTNIAKHAGVSRATVSVDASEDAVRVVVEDRGRGFQTSSRARPSTGLGSMAERALALGGRLEVNSSPGNGTTVRALLPRGVAESEEAHATA